MSFMYIVFVYTLKKIKQKLLFPFNFKKHLSLQPLSKFEPQ